MRVAEIRTQTQRRMRIGLPQIVSVAFLKLALALPEGDRSVRDESLKSPTREIVPASGVRSTDEE